MEQLVRRMIGAAKLDRSTYEEVEADTGATGQAALVVIIVSIASGLGVLGIVGPLGVIWGILLGLAGWVLFAALAYWIGVNLLPKPETGGTWTGVRKSPWCVVRSCHHRTRSIGVGNSHRLRCQRVDHRGISSLFAPNTRLRGRLVESACGGDPRLHPVPCDPSPSFGAGLIRHPHL